MSLINEIVNPNETLKIPEWITEEYFVNILNKNEADFVEIENFKATAAIPEGENFTSRIVRVYIVFKTKDNSTKLKTYIIKAMLDADKSNAVLDALPLFPKEVEMYAKYIPAFEALYNDAGKSVHFGAKCVHAENQKDNFYLIFEDLTSQKFENANRIEGLDMQHMRCCLENLAEFHAASAVYAERNGPYSKNFNIGFINPKAKGQTRESYEQRTRTYKAAMLSWGLEDVQKYIDKFPTYQQYIACALRSLEYNETDFNVLCHGDFWTGNIMFNYNLDGSIDKSKLIDYQVCNWGSPAADLLFFITLSANKEIRIKYFDNFIEIYYEHLIGCLKLLKYEKPLPKLRELHKATYDENVGFYAFFAVFNHLVAILLPKDPNSNIKSFQRLDKIGDEFRMAAFTNPIYVGAAKELYPFYYRRGLYNFEDF